MTKNLGGALLPPSFGQNPKEQQLFFCETIPNYDDDDDDEMIFQSSTLGQSQRENAFCSISISLWHQRKTNEMHIGRNLECDLVLPPF